MKYLYIAIAIVIVAAGALVVYRRTADTTTSANPQKVDQSVQNANADLDAAIAADSAADLQAVDSDINQL